MKQISVIEKLKTTNTIKALPVVKTGTVVPASLDNQYKVMVDGAEGPSAAATALTAISTAAESDSATPTTPSDATYATAGITGVTAANLAAILASIAATADDGNGVDTFAELQDIVTAAAPTCTISHPAGTANGNVTDTFQFSEAVSGFDISDITLDHGTKGTFTSIDSDTYTLVVTPPYGSENLIVEVTTGGFNDAAGYANTADTAIDTVAYNVAPPASLDFGMFEGLHVNLVDPRLTSSGKLYYKLDSNGSGAFDGLDGQLHHWADYLLNGGNETRCFFSQNRTGDSDCPRGAHRVSIPVHGRHPARRPDTLAFMSQSTACGGPPASSGFPLFSMAGSRPGGAHLKTKLQTKWRFPCQDPDGMF